MIVEPKPEHSNRICEVVRASITNLCVLDHKNDIDILAPWLSNKTTDNFKIWISNPKSKSFVAIEEGCPIGISLIGNDGLIYLCYVHPQKVGNGFGKQLLLACEQQASFWGLKELEVFSSFTAKTFYETQGFKSNGEPFTEDNLRSYPLLKRLKA